MLGLLERLIILQPQRTAQLLKALPSSWQQYQRMQALKRSLRLVGSRSIFYRDEEFDMAARRGAVSFYLLGLQKEDRMLNAFDFSFWFPGYFMSRLLPLTEMFSITVGKIEPIEVYRRMED